MKILNITTDPVIVHVISVSTGKKDSVNLQPRSRVDLHSDHILDPFYEASDKKKIKILEDKIVSPPKVPSSAPTMVEKVTAE